jgi:hypothetical protein
MPPQGSNPDERRGSKPGERRGGRGKGTPNQLSGDVKAMILAALDAVGGTEYLMRQAELNPVAFMSLLGKLLPTQLTGKDGGAILNVFDPTTLSDAELADRIDRLRRSAIAYGTPEAEDVPELQEAGKPPGAVH